MEQTMTLDKLGLLNGGEKVAKRRRSSPANDSEDSGEKASPKKRRGRKKKVVELSPEELEMQAKTKKAMGKKGIWEVTIDDGVILGLFNGTPSKIGAFIVAQQEETPHALYFQLIRIRDVPEQISKNNCCERKFTRKDNFCPLCGSPKNVNPGIPSEISIEVFTDLG